MRIVRYAAPSGPRYGIAADDTLYELIGDPLGDAARGAAVGPLASQRLLTPVEPAIIVCVGNNYDALLAAKGLERPEIPNVFLKAVNSLTGPDTDVIKPAGIERFEFEGELVLVISRTASRIAAADWREFVAGFSIGNDMSAREWQLADTQWWRAKSADGFCPVGPWIENEIADPHDLKLQTRVNGEIKQDSSTRDLTFGLGEVLEIITASITLRKGDIVLTGTPPGFCPLYDGDVLEVEIEGIGTLRNTVRQGT